MLTDDATLTYMKASYIEGDKPSRDDALELIDEIKRLRAQNGQLRTWLDGAREIIAAYQEGEG